jgi:hypothetical protein
VLVFTDGMQKQLDAVNQKQNELEKHISKEAHNLLVCIQSPTHASLHRTAEVLDILMPIDQIGLPVDSDTEITEFSARIESDKKLSSDTVRLFIVTICHNLRLPIRTMLIFYGQ